MPRLADDFISSVVFLYPTEGAALGASREGGTGFITYMRNGAGRSVRYLVTNEHIANRGYRFVRVPRQPDEEGQPAFGVVEVPPESWHTMPPNDLAVAPFPLPSDQRWLVSGVSWDEYAVTEAEITADRIGPGDDVALVGRLRGFEGVTRHRVFVRFGSISAMPGEPLRDGRDRDVEVFVVDVRAQQGFSGAPVFLNINLMHPRELGSASVSPGVVTGVLGVAAGYLWTADEQRQGTSIAENSGLTLVVPARAVTELFRRADVAAEREALSETQDYLGPESASA